MTGSSLANAFLVLKRKPMVLLLLLPVQALAPLFLLAIPLLSDTPDDGYSAFFRTLLILGMLALAAFVALARACLLMPPAMELLHDGAAGSDTTPGWYQRGLKKHWWKRISLSVAQWSVSSAAGLIAQVIMYAVSLLIMLPFIPLMDDDNFAYMAGFSFMVSLLYVGIALLLFLFQFVTESVGALLLAALADRGFAGAFKAVFGKRGTGKYAKLLGGRFLVGALSWVVVTATGFFCLVLFSVSHASGVYVNPLTDPIIVFAACACIFITSYLSVYRNAFEFCVFQEINKEEAETADKSGSMALTKKGE